MFPHKKPRKDPRQLPLDTPEDRARRLWVALSNQVEMPEELEGPFCHLAAQEIAQATQTVTAVVDLIREREKRERS